MRILAPSPCTVSRPPVTVTVPLPDRPALRVPAASTVEFHPSVSMTEKSPTVGTVGAPSFRHWA